MPASWILYQCLHSVEEFEDCLKDLASDVIQISNLQILTCIPWDKKINTILDKAYA